MFTLVDVMKRDNPYRQAGMIHMAGLDYVIANLSGSSPTMATTNYIAANYGSNANFITQTVDPISVMGCNLSRYPKKDLQDVNLEGGYNDFIGRIMRFVDEFPPNLGPSTQGKSYLMFDTDFSTVFGEEVNELMEEVLDAPMSEEERILPLIGLALLLGSYGYWYDCYNNTGGSNA